MLTIDLKNIFSNDVSESDFRITKEFIENTLTNIHAHKQGFYEVIEETNYLNDIEIFAQTVEKKYEEIVILGIGGSALGTICIQQSLKHLFENQKQIREYPRLDALDNIDPALINEIEDVIDYRKTLFIVITKSGTTPETLAQYFYFAEKYSQNELKNHFIFITDKEKGFLNEIAIKQDIKTFEIPDNIGGRFSVLTSVGLLPAKLIGVDIRKMVEGASSMKKKFLANSITENIPFQIALSQFLLLQKGKNITVLMPYAQKLIKFADWYRQLLAESIGKAKDNDGKIVNVGITPTNALGVTDQHSQNQLYNEGPNDKLFFFIKVNDFGVDLQIPIEDENHSLSFLKNISFKELMNTELEGTIQALTKNNRPNITIEIDKIDEFSLGELFMLFECSIAILGELLNINAFDQPGVELSKNLTKELLLKKHT